MIFGYLIQTSKLGPSQGRYLYFGILLRVFGFGFAGAGVFGIVANLIALSATIVFFDVGMDLLRHTF